MARTVSRQLLVERACSLAPAAAVAGAVKALTRLGYQRSSGSPRGVTLVSGSSDHHRLTVEADGQQLRFLFEGAVLGPPLDEVALQSVVDAAARAVSATPGAVAAPREVRCPLCATVAGPGEVTCAVCGARLEP
jgi:hypothetical protein